MFVKWINKRQEASLYVILPILTAVAQHFLPIRITDTGVQCTDNQKNNVFFSVHLA